jgi:hypothetical protein
LCNFSACLAIRATARGKGPLPKRLFELFGYFRYDDLSLPVPLYHAINRSSHTASPKDWSRLTVLSLQYPCFVRCQKKKKKGFAEEWWGKGKEIKIKIKKKRNGDDRRHTIISTRSCTKRLHDSQSGTSCKLVLRPILSTQQPTLSKTPMNPKTIQLAHRRGVMAQMETGRRRRPHPRPHASRHNYLSATSVPSSLDTRRATPPFFVRESPPCKRFVWAVGAPTNHCRLVEFSAADTPFGASDSRAVH